MVKGRKKRQRDKAKAGNLPQKQNPQLVRRVTQQVSASFSGPIPPPDILIKYNDAIPHGAERILEMAEKQNEHRMALETKVISADIVRANFGVAAGLIVAVLFGVLSFLLIRGGQQVAGLILGTGDLVGLVGVFVYGTISRRSERKQRVEMIEGQGPP